MLGAASYMKHRQTPRFLRSFHPDPYFEVEAFQRAGYVLRRAMFDTDEVALMNDVIQNDPSIREATFKRKDSSGAATELALWFTLGDDIFGAASRSERIVDSIEALLCGPASFFHSKLTLKKPRVGGAWE